MVISKKLTRSGTRCTKPILAGRRTQAMAMVGRGRRSASASRSLPIIANRPVSGWAFEGVGSQSSIRVMLDHW
jgi:hypothetical protein